MRVGFTGTQLGMSNAQKKQFALLLQHIKAEDMLDEELSIFHHGDCIGADEEAHNIATSLGFLITIHPSSPIKRAYCKGNVVKKPLPYLVRNRQIVDATDVLFVAPKTMVETVRSGTWSTYRYAMKLEKAVILLER